MRRRPATAVAVGTLGAAGLVLTACGPDAANFQAKAEEYIASREFSQEAGLLRYTDVRCEEPASTAQDTPFSCVAVATEGGSRWRFEAVITGETDLQVLPTPQPLDGVVESTVPAGG